MLERRALGFALGGALAIAALCRVSVVAAASGDPATATISGTWVITATVTSYSSGASVPPSYPLGHSGQVTVPISETCTSPGNCTLTLGPPVGGSNFDDATGLLLTGQPQQFIDGVLTPLGQTSGYGGPHLPPCPPPHPEDLLTMQVTQAVSDASGDHAVTIAGQQRQVESWTCNGSQAVGLFQIITFVGHPLGYAAPSPTPAPSPTATARPAAISHTTTTPGGTGSIAHPLPNTITSAIATPGDTVADPKSLAINAAITVVVLLFVTFPANLFNRTFDENYDEIMGIVDRRLPWLARLRARTRSDVHVNRRHLIVFLTVLLLGAIVGGFLDPSFGFNGSSLTTLLSTLLSITFGLLVGTTLGAVYRRLRGHPLTLTPRALPAGLAIAVVCVVISRVSSFHPGYLYGVICGIAFTAPITKLEEAHLVALGTITTLVLAVVAWFIWVPLHVAAAKSGAGFGTVLADDFVGALFVGGLVGSVIGLFPLRFLPGATLASWNRVIWAATFGIAVFGLLQLMLRPESSAAHSTKAALVTALVLFVLFGGASVLFRYYFYRRHRRVAPAPATS